MATRSAILEVGVKGEQQYKQVIAELNRGNQVLNAEMKKLAEEYKGNESSMEAMRAKSDVLERQLSRQKDKVQTLRDALQNAATSFGEADRRTQSWQTQLLNAERDQIKLERALEETNKALEDEADGADEAGDELADLGEKTDDASDKTSIFAGVLKANLVQDAIRFAIDGLKELGEMAIDFGKKIIDSYGELEQNLGGSEAVFGEYAETIQRASESAYKTLGTSQSEFLAAANKMGALFQGSGIEVERSMELTTQAIQRAADVASVMGVDTSAALEAVTGAAKGNYTMMDNLGVKMDATTLKAYALSQGMSKTWEEMSNAEKAELAMKYFFEQTEKYAGNFEEESRKTISGSIGMLQASVETWVAGLGNAEADIGVLTGNVIDSFETVVSNVIPIVENVIQSAPQIYESVMSAVEQRSPELAENLRGFIEPLGTMLGEFWELGENLLPIVIPLLEGVASAISAIIGPISEAVGWLADFVGYLSMIDEEAIAQTMIDVGDMGYNAAAAYNAAGDDNWRGGLTWVGDGGGPELVRLPQGSTIYPAQESRQMAAASATDTSRIETLLSRIESRLERVEYELADAEAVRRMA